MLVAYLLSVGFGNNTEITWRFDMEFCPDWLFDAALANTAADFLKGEMPLSSLAKKYASGLSEKYDEVRVEEISAGVEEVVRFLGEVEAGEEAVNFLRGFAYFRLYFEGNNKPRKMKMLFGNIDDPVKVKSYASDEAVKKFKAYVFALRSESAPLAPPGWQAEDVKELEHFAEVASRSVSLLDGF